MKITSRVRQFFPIVCLLLYAPVFSAPVEVIGDKSPDASWVPLTSALAQQQVSIMITPNPNPLSARMADASALIHNDTVSGTSLTGSAPIIPTPLSSAQSPSVVSADPSASTAAYPPPLNTLANAVSFIQAQRYTFPDGTKGLPSSYYVPPSLNGQILDNNPDADRLIREGTDLYDNSLSIMALIDGGDMADAKSLLDIYTKSTYGNMALQAQPNGIAFQPFGPNAFYLFSFVRANGTYQNINAADPSAWQYYTPDTGENAWLVLAISQYVKQAESQGATSASLQTYINLASDIGNGMIALQSSNPNPPGDTTDHGASSQGCIRESPFGTYSAGVDPYNVCNTENNLSAYAALHALYSITQNNPTLGASSQKYLDSANEITHWLQDADVYLPAPAKSVSQLSSSDSLRPAPGRPTPGPRPQKGLLDRSTGLLDVGVAYNPVTKHWEVQTDSNEQPIVATDSGGTWAISSLGPQQIDQMWGTGTAEKMYSSIRALTGRTAIQAPDGTITSMQNAGATGRLDGFDFSNLYPGQPMISLEWTGGAINAVKQLQNYYGADSSYYAGLTADLKSMQAFLATTSNSYAVGPGLGGSRQGNTGFGWQSAPAGVSATASIYEDLTQDPLAAARQ